MAIETFAWRIQAGSQSATKSTDNIRKIQFGDGYSQVSGNGINEESLSYEFSFSGNPQTAMDIYKFLRRHKTKSFSFQPPFGELALWRVGANTLQKTPLNKKIINISATFEQAFAP